LGSIVGSVSGFIVACGGMLAALCIQRESLVSKLDVLQLSVTIGVAGALYGAFIGIALLLVLWKLLPAVIHATDVRRILGYVMFGAIVGTISSFLVTSGRDFWVPFTYFTFSVFGVALPYLGPRLLILACLSASLLLGLYRDRAARASGDRK
jgi:hypothetical protein